MNSLFHPTLAIGPFGTTELLLIFAVVILLFGAKKLPELAKGLGKSIKEFKKASEHDEDAGEAGKPAAKPDDKDKPASGPN